MAGGGGGGRGFSWKPGLQGRQPGGEGFLGSQWIGPKWILGAFPRGMERRGQREMGRATRKELLRLPGRRGD